MRYKCQRLRQHDEARVMLYLLIIVDASSIHHVRAGFAVLIRKRLPDAAPKMSNFKAKLEGASNLVAYRIANVPATTRTLDGTRAVDAECNSTEIYFNPSKKPTWVRHIENDMPVSRVIPPVRRAYYCYHS